ncbi:hypothetical protein HZ326_19141 [Fusarium oxysporum f. sp. albedinis]|nr:hypothetical protein HZ326_19141 [Fusarium oxysporum f. sp. albedinis]
MTSGPLIGLRQITVGVDTYHPTIQPLAADDSIAHEGRECLLRLHWDKKIRRQADIHAVRPLKVHPTACPPNYLSQASAPSKIQYQSGFGWLLWMNR